MTRDEQSLRTFNRLVEESHFPPIFPFNGSGGPDYMTGWDLCVLGGEQLPGIADVTGPGIRLKKDPNAKAGSNGGRPVYHGLEEQEPRIKIIVWTQSQISILWSIRMRLVPLPGTQPKNVSLDTPYLKLIGVTAAAVAGATGFTWHSSGKVARGLEMTITASHWLGGAKGAGKNATAQPKRAIETTRPYTPGQPPPTSIAGSCAPAFQPGA